MMEAREYVINSYLGKYSAVDLLRVRVDIKVPVWNAVRIIKLHVPISFIGCSDRH